jgi:hypothetical protein
MSPDAAKQTLLYVSDIGTSSVQVLAYPSGTLVGTLTGFGYPQGECVDSSGNVYIADGTNSVIDEYAHGGTSPIATLSDAGAFPASCAVDPTTGNLAVANLLTTQNFEAGNVAIYTKGGGNPAIYADSTITREYFLDYDLSGNVFVAGVSGETGYFRYAEVSPNGTFTDIAVKGAKIGFGGGVQRDGTNMIVVDQQGSVLGKPDMYRIAPTGKVVGHTTLLNSSGGRLIDPVQFAFAPSKGRPSQVVTADALGATVYVNGFPQGSFAASYGTSLVQPLGIAISKPSGG